MEADLEKRVFLEDEQETVALIFGVIDSVSVFANAQLQLLDCRTACCELY